MRKPIEHYIFEARELIKYFDFTEYERLKRSLAYAVTLWENLLKNPSERKTEPDAWSTARTAWGLAHAYAKDSYHYDAHQIAIFTALLSEMLWGIQTSRRCPWGNARFSYMEDFLGKGCSEALANITVQNPKPSA